MEGIRRTDAIRIQAGENVRFVDKIALEEPLGIYIIHRGEKHHLGLTMRTPGCDESLVTGFLYSEGIIDSINSIKGVELVENTAEITLHDDVDFEVKSHNRITTKTSACGVCGKESLSHLPHNHERPLNSKFQISSSTLLSCTEAIISAQQLFELTGGTHAAAAFDPLGNLLCIEEDIGRHNAMDKLVGTLMLERKQIGDNLVFVSGRSSFELAQKAIRAGFPLLASVGAVSSFAVDLAREHDLTLVSFVKEGRLVIHSSSSRIVS